MPAIAAPPPPETSLLARSRGPDCYRDAFRLEMPRRVALADYIAAFYGSAAFTPERWVLGLIGRGAVRADIPALAEGRTDRFAAWSVESRGESEILLRDFRDRTCSWLMAEPSGNGTRLWFGSGVRGGDKPLVRALVPLHRWYSRRLLAGAARELR